jgi:Mn2+/Fe2+ NRAMP family transporter
MKFRSAFTKRHLQIFLALPAALFAVTLLFSGSLSVAFITLSGPFAGAFERDWQSCCAEYSWFLASCVVPIALFGGVLQLLLKPSKKYNLLRYIIWGLALIPWYASGWFSIMHAIS